MSKVVKLSREMLRSIINEVAGGAGAGLPEEVAEAVPQLKLEGDPEAGYYVVNINRPNTRMFGGDRVMFVWLADFEKALMDCMSDQNPDSWVNPAAVELNYEDLVAAAEAWADMNSGIYYAKEKHEFNLDDAAQLAIDSGSSLVVYDNMS